MRDSPNITQKTGLRARLLIQDCWALCPRPSHSRRAQVGAFAGKRRSLLPGESYEKQGHKQNDLSKPEACVVWDVSGQLPSGPLKPGVSHLLSWLACPSPLTPFYMTGQAAPSCTLAVLCPLQALNTPTSEYSQGSYISQSCPSSQNSTLHPAIQLCT